MQTRFNTLIYTLTKDSFPLKEILATVIAVVLLATKFIAKIFVLNESRLNEVERV